jgi:MoxR-like ATPase
LIQDKIRELTDSLNEGLVGRETEIKLGLLAIFSRENLILIGPPGTAKSEVSRRLSQVINGSEYFEYLLTKFSTPEELFGPLSIKDLKEGIYKRNIQSYIPTSNIAFLDEIFKANSAILNALLTLINERVFHNGAEKVGSPLISLISASNELPIGNSELEALYDRFLFRGYVGYLSASELEKLLDIDIEPFSLDSSLKFSLEEIDSIQKSADTVYVSEKIKAKLLKVRAEFKDLFKENTDENLSDRRFLKLLKCLKISAYTNGRQEVDISDLMLLRHCLWSNPDNRKNVSDIINKVVLGE